MPRPHRNLILAITLFALMGAQVFGLQRGFVCLCSGDAIESATRYCADEDNGCAHEENGVPYQHAPLTVKIEALAKIASNLQIQIPALVAILDFAEIPLIRPVLTAYVRWDALDPYVNPPASLQVADCKVLLI
jgi:hypothetical protein